MPKVAIASMPQTNRTGYPPHYADVVQGRWVRRLAPVVGLTGFGASHVVLQPGAWSAQRHWHENEDELVVILAGEAVLIEDNGRTPMQTGDIAAFPKNDGNGHCIANESRAECTLLVIGQTVNGPAHFPDVDLAHADGAFVRRDGRAF